MSKPDELTFSVGLDLQKMHDDLVVVRDSLTAQIKAMEESSRVCPHPHSALAMETMTNARGIPMAVCNGCNTWVPVRQE